MNRQQQRQAEKINRQQAKAKRSKPRETDKAVAWTFIKNTLSFASVEPQTKEETIRMMAPYYVCLGRLTTTGTFDRSDFDTLNIMWNCAFNIGYQLHKDGDDETKLVLMPTLPVIEAAGKALESIGQRWAEKDKWGATGDDLQALRDLAGVLEQLMNVSTRGIVSQSLTKAQMRVQLENEKAREQKESH